MLKRGKKLHAKLHTNPCLSKEEIWQRKHRNPCLDQQEILQAKLEMKSMHTNPPGPHTPPRPQAPPSEFRRKRPKNGWT